MKGLVLGIMVQGSWFRVLRFRVQSYWGLQGSGSRFLPEGSRVGRHGGISKYKVRNCRYNFCRGPQP